MWELAAACAGVCVVPGTFKGEAFLPQLLPLHFAASATTLWLSAFVWGSEASSERSGALAERVEGCFGAGMAFRSPEPASFGGGRLPGGLWMAEVGRQAAEASGGLDIGLSDIAFGQTGPYGTEKITHGACGC